MFLEISILVMILQKNSIFFRRITFVFHIISVDKKNALDFRNNFVKLKSMQIPTVNAERMRNNTP